jgi:hypothetical protein
MIETTESQEVSHFIGRRNLAAQALWSAPERGICGTRPAPLSPEKLELSRRQSRWNLLATALWCVEPKTRDGVSLLATAYDGMFPPDCEACSLIVGESSSSSCGLDTCPECAQLDAQNDLEDAK